MRLKTVSYLAFGLLFVCLVAVASAQTPEPAASPPAGATVPVQVPFMDEWANSAHADAASEPFRHWDEEDVKEVPVNCARCHSGVGLPDYLGADGSAVEVVDKAASLNTVIACTTCHNKATRKLDWVVMPSTIKIAGLGPEAICMQCHQGRASKVQVDASIEKAKLADMDTPSKDLGFTNIHYFAAAATMYGTVAKGGYEYEGKAYDSKFDHVVGYSTCTGCHDQHSLEVRVQECAACHQGVATKDDLKKIRMFGSLADYDGDGDTQEGIYFEIEGLRNMLFQAIQSYAQNVSKAAIVYDPATHPYFFLDTNANGQPDPDEAKSDNRFNAWTGRLAKAAYNYQQSIKDPGQFAHGGKYIIELLYDSIENLNAPMSAGKVDLTKAHRIDAGHFAGSEEAFRHWDAEGMVVATCAKCHSGTGLPTMLAFGAVGPVPPTNGLFCSTCHNDLAKFTRYEVKDVTFPSGATLALDDPDANLCLECHQGRESAVSLGKTIEGLPEDQPSEKLRFLNPHYFAAGATLFGSQAHGAYEYPDKTYLGQNKHVPDFDTCVECHDVHALTVKAEACGGCHQDVKTEEDLPKISMMKVDYDANGTAEPIAVEIEGLEQALLGTMQDYAKTVAGGPIAYAGTSYPYWMADTNDNGQADPDEATGANAYKNWTPRLLKAAYNYQWVQKDPGRFAHNGKYIVQILQDTLADLSAQVKPATVGASRP